MTTKKLALAAVAATALLGASGAFANPQDYRDYRDYRWHERHHYYHPRYVAQRVAVQPAPYYVQPAPVYSPAPREIYGSFPIGKADVRVGVQF